MKILNIGHDSDGYFVYDSPGEKLFKGTYTQCLIIIGGVSTGRDTLDESIALALQVTQE